MTQGNHDDSTNLFSRGINSLTQTIKDHTPKALRKGVAATGLAALALGAGEATGQSIETYNRAEFDDNSPNIEQITIARDKFDGSIVSDATVATSLYNPELEVSNPTGKLTTTAGVGLDTGTGVYAFTEHDDSVTELEIKANQSIGDHVATVGHSTTGDSYAGFRANHFQDTGLGAHIIRQADGDIDVGGSLYKLWDNGVFSGVRKEADNIYLIGGMPSSDGPALRTTTIYGVEDNAGFMMNSVYGTWSSTDTYYGANKFDRFAASTGSVFGGDEAISMNHEGPRYVPGSAMFYGDGPSASVTHTEIADNHSIDVEAYTDLESIGLGLEDVLVGGHAGTDMTTPQVDRLGVDVGYNGDNINGHVSYETGPSGEPAAQITFHYKP